MESLAKRIQSQVLRSRIMMYGVLMPIAAISLAGIANSFLRILWVVLGFSLIIFLHELGHFVVARLCSVRCLAFSLGIGPRMFGWRKGAGFSFGADPLDPEAKKEHTPTLEEAEVATTHADLPTTATPPEHSSLVGDCDYRVSWLPLGGYVRMLGQDDMDPTKISTDPHAFNQRPIWQRMCIVSAGVIMNVIFAAVAFSIIFSPGIGVDFPPAQLGQVVYDSPAWKAGLHMGDRIVAIDGKKPPGQFVEFTDVMIASALSNGQDAIKYEYIPYGETATKTVAIVPVVNAGNGFLGIGVESMIGTKIGGSGEEYAKQTPATVNTPELSKIRENDEIIAVDGEDVRDNYIKMYNYIQSKNGAPVALTLENAKNKSLPDITIHMTPRLEPRLGVQGYPAILGMAPRVVLGKPGRWSAASAAGLKDGDVVIKIGDRANPTEEQFHDIVAGNPGKPLDITIDRDGTQQTVQATPKLSKGVGLLGVYLEEDPEKMSFVPVSKERLWKTSILLKDAAIVSIDGQKVSSWFDIYGILRNKAAGDAIPVTFSADKGTLTKSLTLSADDAKTLSSMMHYELGIQLAYRTETQKADNVVGAVAMGMDHTKKFIFQVYMTLAGLFRGTVSPSNLHGIVGITKVGYDAQQKGMAWLWYILALVSVNLAVANFLPLPIVDGGLFLLLILEKIRGKPLSLKVQSAIQVVGLVLLACMFLFVTFNDISLFLIAGISVKEPKRTAKVDPFDIFVVAQGFSESASYALRLDLIGGEKCNIPALQL